MPMARIEKRFYPDVGFRTAWLSILGDLLRRTIDELEGIRIALDFKGDRMFLTDLAGSIYSAKLDGTGKKPLLVAQGNLTGIAYAEINTKEN